MVNARLNATMPTAEDVRGLLLHEIDHLIGTVLDTLYANSPPPAPGQDWGVFLRGWDGIGTAVGASDYSIPFAFEADRLRNSLRHSGLPRATVDTFMSDEDMEVLQRMRESKTTSRFRVISRKMAKWSHHHRLAERLARPAFGAINASPNAEMISFLIGKRELHYYLAPTMKPLLHLLQKTELELFDAKYKEAFPAGPTPIGYVATPEKNTTDPRLRAWVMTQTLVRKGTT